MSKVTPNNLNAIESVNSLLNNITVFDANSVLKSHFDVTPDVMSFFLEQYKTNSLLIFEDKFYDVINHEHQMGLARESIWLRKRVFRGNKFQWALYMTSESNLLQTKVVVFNGPEDEAKIVEKVNEVLNINLTSLEELECVATIPTHRCVINKYSPIFVCIDSFRLSEHEYSTLGTFSVRGGTHKSPKPREFMDLIWSKRLEAAPSKVLQYLQMNLQAVYKHLPTSLIENYLIISKIHHTPTFQFGNPKKIDWENLPECKNATYSDSDEEYSPTY